MTTDIDIVRVAREAAQEGRHEEAARILEEVAPDFVHVRRSAVVKCPDVHDASFGFNESAGVTIRRRRALVESMHPMPRKWASEWAWNRATGVDLGSEPPRQVQVLEARFNRTDYIEQMWRLFTDP